MQNDQTSSTNKFTSLETLVKLTPIFTALVLAISVIYDSAYLWALGLTLFDIPSSISEHLRSALLWSPVVLAISMFLGLMYIQFIQSKLNKNSSSNKIFKDTSKYQSVITLVLGLITIFLLIGMSYLKKSMFPIFFLIPVFWILVVNKLLDFYIHKKIAPSIFILCLYLIPILLFFFGLYGYISGYQTIHSKTPKWEYSVKKEEKEILMTIFAQRRFTDFTIAILNDNKILIIPNGNISSMRSL